jgi:hypothetical protein
MSVYYVLDAAGNPCKANLTEWAQFFESPKKRVLQQDRVGKYFVSTVFLGIDHNFAGGGEPLLWETMIFPEGGLRELYQCRYSTLQQAESGHQSALNLARSFVAGGQS